MANTATLQTLRDRVGANADVAISTTGFGATAQVDQWVNDALAKLHYLLANSGEDYFNAAPQVITLVNGTKSYPLAADFYKAKGVDLVVGSESFDVPRYMATERNTLDDFSVTLVQNAYCYRILANTIQFIPLPGTGTIRVNYVPQFAKLVAPGDVVHSSVPEGWEAFAAYEASAMLLAKEESDPSAMQGKAAEIWTMMKTELEPRDQVEPLRTSDVYGRFTRDRFGRDRWG